jgi:IS30 family transposase
MSAREAEGRYDVSRARWGEAPTRENAERLDRARSAVFTERKRESRALERWRAILGGSAGGRRSSPHGSNSNDSTVPPGATGHVPQGCPEKRAV